MLPRGGEAMQEAHTAALSGKLRLKIALSILAARFREYLNFDSLIVRALTASLGMAAGFLLYKKGRRHKGLSLLARVHRLDTFDSVDRAIETWVDEKSRRGELLPLYIEHVRNVQPAYNTGVFFKNPERLAQGRAIILKSPRVREKGVVILDYTGLFPVFAKFYDLHRLSQNYHIVLEPGWSGYFDLDILCFSQYDCPIFVQAYEPRDSTFLQRLGGNLKAVPLSTNWWVDYRIMRPLDAVRKDVDVVMCASWNLFKRHHYLFAALAHLKRRGKHLKAVLIGYPGDLSGNDVFAMAQYFGVDRQIEMYERLSPEEVNVQFNRARVNIIWSRKEGVNRAIIEGMFAGVPCILRQGFNYGHRYDYVNPLTGCFATEETLPEKLLWMTENYGRFATRDWVMQHMSCQRSAKTLGDSIRQTVCATGEDWTEDLAVKVSYLDKMRYWNDSDVERFAPDFQALRSSLLGVPG